MIMQTISKLQTVMATIIAVAITACTSRVTIPLEDGITFSSDSTLFFIQDTLSIDIHSDLNPTPSISQIINHNGSDFYLSFDNQSINIYNLTNNHFEHKLPLSSIPHLKSLSGFRYIDKFYYIYDYTRNHIYKLDTIGKICSDLALHSTQEIDPWGISGTSIIGDSTTIYLSGPPSRKSKKNDFNKTSIAVDLSTGTFVEGGTRPSSYSNFKIGKDYFWRVYHTMDSNGNLVISLPNSPFVYVFDRNLTLINKFQMASRYSKELTEATSNMSSVEEKMYYLTHDSYGPIEYDNSKNLFYRIATHPMSNIKFGGRTLKPFSIIITDEKGKYVSETPIFKHDNTIFYDILGATPTGLYIQIHSHNEDIIKFIILNNKS